MEVFTDICEGCLLAYGLCFFIAGLHGTVMYGGVGPIRLLGMLWRGQVQGRW